MKKYFELANSQEDAVEYWNKSQYDLTDIILAMTDNGIFEGHKLYALFKLEVFNAVMNVCKFNFKLVKNELGISGDYVERGGNVYASDYNPKRNPQVLIFSGEELQKRATEVYKTILEQFKKVTDKIIKNANNPNKF